MSEAIKTRCKVRVVGVEKLEGFGGENVRLAASYDTSNPEDVSFAQATPSGELKIYVSNPKVIGTFEPGKNYYLDLVPCE